MTVWIIFKFKRRIDLQNQATEKLSPFKTPTQEQSELINDAKDFIYAHLHDATPAVFVITGDAGTGKSVVLSQLFYQIQQAAHDNTSDMANTSNYFMVNHPELLKVYRHIAGELPGLLKKNFQRPTSLINQMNKHHETFDVGVIDESHLLLSQPDHYNNYYGHNQLLSLLKLCHVLVIVFDAHQVLRLKTYWTQDRLKKLLAPYTQQWVHLNHQFRMQADDSLISWINHFTGDRILLPLQKSFRHHYDFRIFSDAEEMRQAIVSQNKRLGLARIVSTTGYPSTLDGGQHFITEGRFKLPWDQYNYTSTPWAEIPQTINEVGSIYTCQGFDLNYVGLILGPVVKLSSDGQKIEIDTSKITDVESFKHRTDMADPQEILNAKIQLNLNAINVLMKRGVKGLYLFAHDPALRTRLYSEYQIINH
ncbi:MAG TPA: DNA replication initiation protein [Lactobacillus sp.]|nr:DNA replication initiation protein [Lactobacillus sp.]